MSKLVSVSDYREEAAKILPESTFTFFDDAASRGETMFENSNVFKRWFIRPRVLMDVSEITTDALFLGSPISAPIGISPTAVHALAHPEGECATAKAAAALNMPYVMSIHSSRSMEDISAVAPSSVKLLQFFPLEDKNLALSVFRREEEVGFKGLVATLDYARFGVRYAFIKGLRVPALEKDALIPESPPKAGKQHPQLDPKATWQYIKWVKSVTRLPLILKGIMTEEDAELAVQSGADAVWVSNHGGRQLDGVMPTLEALPEIAKVVNKRLPVYIDSGFKSGIDIFKALALGADMVFIGRPIIWSLAARGEEGVKDILSLMKMELSTAQAFTGCASIGNIKRDKIARAYDYRL